MKKLAMIGCGGIGEYHLEHFVKYEDVELAGFCDIIPERAENFAKIAGRGKAFDHYLKMYDEVKPDMVFICIPPYAHGEIEFETIKRGIPFFVEKPLALDISLAKEILAASEEKKLVTASGFQCRYSNIVDDTFQFAKAHPILFVDCVRVGGIPGTPWWGKKALSGGQIVEQTIHNFDMVRYIMGEPESVFTLGARGLIDAPEGYDTDDLSTTTIRFASGALGTISTGCYGLSGNACDSKITFSARDARLDHYIIGRVNIYEDEQQEAEGGGFVIKNDGSMARSSGGSRIVQDDGTAGEVCDRTFVDAALTGDASKIRSSYRDALATVAFTLACNESMDKGEPVKISL